MLSAPIPSLISKFLGQQSSIINSTIRDKHVIVRDLLGEPIVPDLVILPFFCGEDDPVCLLLAFLFGGDPDPNESAFYKSVYVAGLEGLSFILFFREYTKFTAS